MVQLPDITAVRPDVLNANYHVITNAIQLSQLHPMPAKFQHVTNIETCTLRYYTML